MEAAAAQHDTGPTMARRGCRPRPISIFACGTAASTGGPHTLAKLGPFPFLCLYTVRNYKDLDRYTAQTKRDPPCITQQIAIQLLYQWRPDSDWITQTVAIRQNQNNAISDFLTNGCLILLRSRPKT